jgi:glutaredoxin
MSLQFEKPSLDAYTIYSKSGCYYCTKAKELLKSCSPVVINCDEYLFEDRDGFLTFIKSMAGERECKTFPMIFYKGEYLGGHTETKEHYERQQAFADIDV